MRPSGRSRLLVVVLMAVAAVVLSGCSGAGPSTGASSSVGGGSTTSAGGSSATPSPTDAPVDVSPPRLGACYDYGYLELADPSVRLATDGASSSEPAVACSATHTAVTYYVGRLSGDQAKGVDPQAPAVLNAETTTCEREWFQMESRASVLTRAYVFSFTPSGPQWLGGARWYRCDAVLHASNKSIVPIPANFLAQLRTAAGRAEYRACVTKTFVETPCTRPHKYSAWSYTWLHGSTRFPGLAAVKKAANAFCLRSIKPGHYYYYYWPFALGWAHGNYSAVCYDGGTTRG